MILTIFNPPRVKVNSENPSICIGVFAAVDIFKLCLNNSGVFFKQSDTRLLINDTFAPESNKALYFCFSNFINKELGPLEIELILIMRFSCFILLLKTVSNFEKGLRLKLAQVFD